MEINKPNSSDFYLPTGLPGFAWEINLFPPWARQQLLCYYCFEQCHSLDPGCWTRVCRTPLWPAWWPEACSHVHGDLCSAGTSAQTPGGQTSAPEVWSPGRWIWQPPECAEDQTGSKRQLKPGWKCCQYTETCLRIPWEGPWHQASSGQETVAPSTRHGAGPPSDPGAQGAQAWQSSRHPEGLPAQTARAWIPALPSAGRCHRLSADLALSGHCCSRSQRFASLPVLPVNALRQCGPAEPLLFSTSHLPSATERGEEVLKKTAVMATSHQAANHLSSFSQCNSPTYLHHFRGQTVHWDACGCMHARVCVCVCVRTRARTCVHVHMSVHSNLSYQNIYMYFRICKCFGPSQARYIKCPLLSLSLFTNSTAALVTPYWLVATSLHTVRQPNRTTGVNLSAEGTQVFMKLLYAQPVPRDSGHRALQKQKLQTWYRDGDDNCMGLKTTGRKKRQDRSKLNKCTVELPTVQHIRWTYTPVNARCMSPWTRSFIFWQSNK